MPDALSPAAVRSAACAHVAGLAEALAVARHEVAQATAERAGMEALQEQDRARAALFAQAIAALNQTIQMVSAANVADLTADVNAGLRSIFHDQDLEFRVVDEVKRNSISYRFELLHDGVAGSTRNFGGSVYAVVALVLKVKFLIYAKCFPMLVMDESLRFVSKEYVARTSQFLRSLADGLDMDILLITHEPAFAAGADVNYFVSEGSPRANGTTLALKAEVKEG